MDAPKIVKEAKMSDETRIKGVEEILRKNIKTKTLTEEAWHYMALLINEDSPKNVNELSDLIIDFMTDGYAYTDDEAHDFCGTIYKLFLEAGLIDKDNKQTIIAEKLSKPITINELIQEGHTGIVREDDFYDPLLAGEKVNSSGNYNTTEGREAWMEKKNKKKLKDDEAACDALDKKINEFMATKEKVPPPRVIHDKSNNSKADIFLPKVTLVAGGKALLDGATLRLTRGRKYGLVGRNGIGKTTLINAMCRRELDKMPMNLHILQVEQEVIGDDMTVLQHVIECDVERL